MTKRAEYKKIVSKISIPANHKIKQKAYLQSGTLPVIDQGQELVGGYTNDCQKQIVCDLPVIVFGDHTKNVKYINFPFCAGADGIKILKAKDDIFPKYLYYGTKFLTFCIEDKGYARHYQHIEKQELSVPPLPEQERIVAKIEELFSQLDAAVAELKSVKEKLAIYRQAVLKEAFENLPDCNQITLGDVIEEKPRNGFSPKGVNFVTKYRNLTLSATTGGFFREGFFKYVDIDINDDSYLWVKQYDILIQRANTIDYVGTAAIYEGPNDQYVYPDLMMKCHTKDGINPFFIVYQLHQSKTQRYYRSKATGTAGNMPKINQTTVMNTPMVFVKKVKQDKIVESIELKFSLCNSIEQTVDTALQRAAAFRQSILKQAFEGNL